MKVFQFFQLLGFLGSLVCLLNQLSNTIAQCLASLLLASLHGCKHVPQRAPLRVPAFCVSIKT
eukprot:1148072-Pelagomonas_calceolata.AAC.2